jgi:hypothetical protein
MLALPMYGGNCTGEFAISLSKACIMLHDLGFQYHVETLYNESLIPRGRNILAHSFMQTGFDYMLFIDSDIGFDEVSLLQLILADRPIAGGVYPKKRINWDVVSKAVKAGKSPDELHQYTGDFAFLLASKEAEPDEDNMLEVRSIATGFMMIRKDVFEKLSPHTQTFTHHNPDGTSYEMHDFFQIGKNPETGSYTSEDYWFCDSWRRIGGKVYMNPYIALSHTGTYRFEGSVTKLGTEKI